MSKKLKQISSAIEEYCGTNIMTGMNVKPVGVYNQTSVAHKGTYANCLVQRRNMRFLHSLISLDQNA